MKISEFATVHNVKKTAVRYYTDQKLLMPKMEGASYNYDERCSRDMKDILEYKELGFSIESIRNIVSYKRFTEVLVEKELDNLLHILDKQKVVIQDEIELLQSKLKRIDFHKEELCEQQEMKEKQGFPISCIELLQCPECNQQLRLDDCEITILGIINGHMECPNCNYRSVIEEGIINCCGEHIERININEISKTNQEWHLICECLYELEDKIKSDDLQWYEGHTYLYNGADTEIITMSLLQDLDKGKVHIFVEQSMEVLRTLKSKIEVMGLEGYFIYICHGDALPLKPCVDRVVDVFGLNMNALYQPYNQSNLEVVSTVFLPECHYRGTIIIANEEEFGHAYFKWDAISKIYNQLGMTIQDKEIIGSQMIDFAMFLPDSFNKESTFNIYYVTGCFHR